MAKKKNKNKNKNGVPSNLGNLTAPPWLSYDPALSADRRATERGLSDLLVDLRKEKKQGRQDVKTTKKDLRQDRTRGLGELSRGFRRGKQDIGFRRQDTRLRQTRGREDFRTELQGLTRRFNVQGQQQMQTANAAGLSGGGTNAAGAVKRSENLALARQPLDTSLQRLETDTDTSLGRLAIDQNRLKKDTKIGTKYLRQDFRHDLGLTKRDWRRAASDIKLRGQRGRREAVIGDTDILAEMVWNARQNNPGAFTRTGRRS